MSFYKRDAIREIEKECQERWERERIFEADAPKQEDGALKNHEMKFMATFPYPYMNGCLHLGHTFTVTKADFAVGYQRLKGKHCLFPFGFHCTGMPIKACTDKLKREVSEFGYPPKFPHRDSEVKNEEEKDNPVSKDPTKWTKKVKSKVAMKGEDKGIYQWEIMQGLGLSDEEIIKFTDTSYWLKYFPPLAEKDLRSLGVKVDWRRSFITTDANPYYDSFVRWHFFTLKDRKKLDFGKRHTIFSPLDNQPSMDHDRSVGEGVGPQEYVLIKLKVVEPFPEKIKALSGKDVFLVAATLRPETMYGQTNCWVHPELTYEVFRVKSGEYFISTHHAALNMAYQDCNEEFGKIDSILTIKGQDIMGIPLNAPFTSYDIIYTLPMLTINEKKGTGIVTSVPSDSPDDFAALRDLKKKKAFREQYNIKDEMVLPFEPIPIINIPDLGNLSAIAACEQMKVNSQHDRVQLNKAKEMTYLRGFYEGEMIIGECCGEKVQVAKKKISQILIDNGQALLYQEPESTVISRSGDECVVALCDQWYIDYGEETWKKGTYEVLQGLRTYSDEVRNNFESTLESLHKHACSRSYGLGTKIPWDEQYLIEALSDSTIYMAYYTVSHLLQGGAVDGSKKGPLGISAEQMTVKVWDYIFFGGEFPDTDIPKEALKLLHQEFSYWYPVDLRVSGKDLIQNHLTYYLYNHLAVWPKPGRGDPGCKWPKAVRANGHLLLNSEKMSKSTGNFLTLNHAVERFSADGTRMTLADAGDGLEDANFVFEMADAGLLRLFTQIEWIKEMMNSKDEMRNWSQDMWIYEDHVFSNEINHAVVLTDENYEKMMFRDALKSGFYDLQLSRDRYREKTSTEGGMNWQLIKRFMEVQALLLSPICPHITEHMWTLMGKEGSIMNARWPTSGDVDKLILLEVNYLDDLLREFRMRIKKMMDLREKKGLDSAHPEYGIIYVADEFPKWQAKTLEILAGLYEKSGSEMPDNAVILQALQEEPELKSSMKKVMPFVQTVKANVAVKGQDALNLKFLFDEKGCFERSLNFITKSLQLSELWVESVTAATDIKVKEECAPGKPMSVFTYEPPKNCATVMAFTPQESVPLHLAIYNEDTTTKIIDRIRRTIRIPVNSSISIWQYMKDPTCMGDEETKTQEQIPLSATFQVQNGAVSFSSGNMGSKPLGSNILYSINQ